MDFNNTPITKFIVCLSVILSVASSVFNLKNESYLHKEGLFQPWRLLSSQFVFIHTGEMFIGILLLYTFRVFERHMGSKKYSVFILFVSIVSTVLEVIFLYFNNDNFAYFCGPYSIIFAQVVQYYYDIPATSPVDIFGIRTNDKIFIYLMAKWFILQIQSNNPYSMYTVFYGLLAGILYRVQVLGIENLVIPNSISNFCSKYILPHISVSSVDTHRNQNTLHNNSRNVFDYTNDMSHSFNYPQPVRQPSIQNIETLISMGVDRETAVQVLTRYNDEIQLAVESLL